MRLTVYDPALCCSTGVCGPAVDPVLVQFAADLEWLRTRGAEVRRYNLGQEAAAFARNPLVRRTLQAEGTNCLPLLLAGSQIVASGRYPAREELLAWCGGDPLANADGGRRTAAEPEEGRRSDAVTPALETLRERTAPGDAPPRR